jgi:hypothetical protein
MQATTFYEFERPKNWKGEIVDMSTFDGELDYFELEVEGDVTIEIDNHYGEDADGNRGGRMDFSYIEDITVILDGDFRPFTRKVRDFLYIGFLRTAGFLGFASVPRFLSKYRRSRLLRRNRVISTKATWTELPGNAEFRFKGLGEEILSTSERESIEEQLFSEVEDGGW